MPASRARRALIGAALLLLSCSPAQSAPSDSATSDSAGATMDPAPTGVDPAPPAGARDSARAVVPSSPLPGRRRPREPLPPLADTIAGRLVFAPAGERWMVAAARGKRLLLDIGRVDTEVRKEPTRLAAYKVAVEARAPFGAGTRLPVRGPWGSGLATVTGFDTWNGRIVAVLDAGPAVDSLARTMDPLVAVADRGADTLSRARDSSGTDSTGATPAAACARGDSLAPALRQRAVAVRDSLEASLRALRDLPTAERLAKSIRARSSQAAGCFGAAGRLALVVNLTAGNYEWVRERAVVLDDAGRATALRVLDLRFKAHDLIGAFDADGDGIDDLATRGFALQQGGTTVLRLVDGKRLERIAAGFSWESR